VFVDRDGYLSSSDVGATLHYNLPAGYGDVHAGLYNGETYSKAETNDQKAFQVRGTVRPFPQGQPALRGLRFTGFYHGDHYVRDAARTRWIGGVTFEHPALNAGYHYLDATDQRSSLAPEVQGRGYSAWVTPRAANGWEGLVRVDRLTPDASLDARQTRTIVGVAYWLPQNGSSTAAVLVDLENVSMSGAAATQPRQRRVAVHALVNF
jgi:hypothetical protein